jgi:predicted RNA polymerase sigma factor
LHLQLKNHDKAKAYFLEAIKLTKSVKERKLLQDKINKIVF